MQRSKDNSLSNLHRLCCDAGKVAEQEARSAVREEKRRAARRTTLAFGLERARRRVVRESGEAAGLGLTPCLHQSACFKLPLHLIYLHIIYLQRGLHLL